MKEYTAYIVDDEYLARSILKRRLSEFPHIRVVGESGHKEKAVTETGALKPDILFLDIQLKGSTGFDLLSESEFCGKVIFVTAFDAYAIRAFEVNALDYLLKPVSRERLKEALNRLEEPARAGTDAAASFRYDDRFLVKGKGTYDFIRISSIVCIRSASDYTTLECEDGREHLTSRTMNDWESRLPGQHFCRIHRSAIINFNHVEQVSETGTRSMVVLMKDRREPLPVSRTYFKKIKEHYG